MSESKQEVIDWYEDAGYRTGAVGLYVKVEVPDEVHTIAMGGREDAPCLGWRIVEIDYERRTFMLAPKEDLEAEEASVDELIMTDQGKHNE